MRSERVGATGIAECSSGTAWWGLLSAKQLRAEGNRVLSAASQLQAEGAVARRRYARRATGLVSGGQYSLPGRKPHALRCVRVGVVTRDAFEVWVLFVLLPPRLHWTTADAGTKAQIDGGPMDLKFWHDRRVLVTGHTGFKGGWLCLWLERLGARVTGIALPPITHPNLFELAVPWPTLRGLFLDIRERDRLLAAIDSHDFEILFHLAAQPIVSEAQRDAVSTFATNVMGAVHILDACLKVPSLRAAVIVTSDKVYENRGDGRAFRESDSFSGDDPYAASKSAVELAVSAYRPAFTQRQKKLATVRAGNVIGGGDWAADRIIPDLVRSLSNRRPTVIRNPAGIRPWQHVLEPLSGYLAFAEQLASSAE